jgi:endonuclease/exonuclease/phosphatase family metal-dependent hydrolase
MSVMNYKEYMDNLNAIFDAYGELIYLCNNFDTSRINDLFINIIQNYDYHTNGTNIIHINENEQKELIKTIIDTKEYTEMLEFVKIIFNKIIKKCNLFEKKIKSFKDNYIENNKENLGDDEKLIDDNLKSQLNTYYFNLKDLCRELKNITKTTKTTKTSNVTFNIVPITTTNTIITTGLYKLFKMMIKSLQVIDSYEDDISVKDTIAIKANFNIILKNLIENFNKNIQSNKDNIQELITKIKEDIPAEHQGEEDEEDEVEVEEEEDEEEEKDEVEEEEEKDDEKAEKKKDKKKGNSKEEEDEEEEEDEDKKKDDEDEEKDKKKDDERVFNFEYQSNSCYVHTALQLIIDNEDLCTEITKFMNKNPYDGQEDGRGSAKYPLQLLSNIIKFYNENKTEIGGEKIKSYKEISEPLRDYLLNKMQGDFPEKKMGDPYDVFNYIINILKELNVPKNDTYDFNFIYKIKKNGNSNWENDQSTKMEAPALHLQLKNNDENKNITLQDLIDLNTEERTPEDLTVYNKTDLIKSYFKQPMKKDLVILIERNKQTTKGTMKTTSFSNKDVLLSEIITLKTLKNKDDENHMDVNYKLKGFANFHSGHYVYYKLLSNNKWVKLNDLGTTMNGEFIDISNLPTDGGTMYYYKKMDDNTLVPKVPPIIPQKQPEISLLSWNLHYSIFKRNDNDSAYENNNSNYKERRDTITNLLITGNYDIICLQETKDINELQEKYKVINNVESLNLASIFYNNERFVEISTEYHYHKKIYSKKDSDLIFSNKDITKDDIYWRPIIKTILEDNETNEQFMIINIWGIHINNIKQSQQIIDFLKNITKESNIRIIICGDMNEFSIIKNLELNSYAFDKFIVMNVTHTCCFDEDEIKGDIKENIKINETSFTMMLDNNPDTTNFPLVTIGDKNTYSDHLSVNYKFTLKSPGAKAAQGKAAPVKPAKPGAQGKAAPAKPVPGAPVKPGAPAKPAPGAQGKAAPVKPANQDAEEFTNFNFDDFIINYSWKTEAKFNMQHPDFYTTLIAKANNKMENTRFYLTNGTNYLLEHGWAGTNSAITAISDDFFIVKNYQPIYHIGHLGNKKFLFDRAGKDLLTTNTELDKLIRDNSLKFVEATKYTGATFYIPSDENFKWNTELSWPVGQSETKIKTNFKQYNIQGVYHLKGWAFRQEKYYVNDNGTKLLIEESIEYKKLVTAYYKAILDHFFEFVKNEKAGTMSILHLCQVPGEQFRATDITKNLFVYTIYIYIFSNRKQLEPMKDKFKISIDHDKLTLSKKYYDEYVSFQNKVLNEFLLEPNIL